MGARTMIDTQTIEAIHAHLDECPTDWTARLELADLYEEAGRDDEAQYQRWAAKHERTPIYYEKHKERRGCMANPWHWFSWATKIYANIGELACGIDSEAYMHGRQTRQQAEADLMQVLIAQGWPAPGVE